jgi:2-oxoisovalerate dehydrogenase E2 component (dihydrolipoyl transacylase)
MAQLKHFALPDAGEGLTEAEIVSWKVKPGDVVGVNQTIVEVETAKSLVELPSPWAGVVTQLLVAEGETVAVGTPIIAVDFDPAAGQVPPPASGGEDQPESAAAEHIPPPEGAVEPGLIGGVAPGGRTAVLVGYGPRAAATRRRPRVGSPHAAVAAAFEVPEAPVAPQPVPAQAAQAQGAAHALAKPPVRKLARDLGIDLGSVPATGPGGVVTREDVEAARAGRRPAEPADGKRETRIPVRGVRKMTAEAMVASAFTAPHVTEWLSVDVSRTLRLVRRLRDDKEFADLKVSPLLPIARALLIAVRRHPEINASWDGDAQEIVIKHRVNLGIAAATPRGLVVPNIKDADRLSLRELAEALAALTATAREGRTQPPEMAGGTITITNVGVFGVDAGTPILNPGEAAILAVGQIRRMPWVHRGRVRPRWVTQLALSFDHRLVDGELGSRVLADVGALLERPDRALLWA